jgi:hypothetical protein
MRTVWRGVVASAISATASAASRPAPISRSAIAPIWRCAMYSTNTSAPRASAAQSSAASPPLLSCPVAKATLRPTPRWVSGMPAAAVPPMPALMPGTIRKGMPAAASALQPHHSPSLARQVDQPLIDAKLLRA